MVPCATSPGRAVQAADWDVCFLATAVPYRVAARAAHGEVARALAVRSRRSAALILALPVRVISSGRKNSTRRGTL